MKHLIAVVGPTGSGKTKLAVKLAKKFNGVIISADSRQVYKGLDIGTNKEGVPGNWGEHTAHIIDGVPQLLIDAVEPGDRFTLADWLTLARKMLSEVWAAGQLPIVVGGTGLYVTALLEGYQPGGGRFAKNNQPVDFKSLILMSDIQRVILNKRSDDRFPKIFDTLLAETKDLLNNGLSGEWLNKIGLDYRYAYRFISGELDREETIKQFQTASRAYIRRQITWWRHHGTPVSVKSTKQAEALVKKFLR
jgi:tRNA A37 N6-isopentenylltransferase MiaA